MKQTRRILTARDLKKDRRTQHGLYKVKGRLIQVLSIAAALAAPFCSFGVAILSGPSFQPATNAPLAGVLQLTTDVDSRVSISVNDGAGVWERNFYDYSTTHSVPLLGFKPDRTNEITVTVRDKYRNRVTAAKVLSFVTSPLPEGFPKIILNTSQPAKMEPGYTLFRAVCVGGNGYVIIVNSSGEVVWYDALPTWAEVQQLENGNLFIPANDTNGFAEINLLGEKVTVWPAPADLQVDIHDGVLTDHGTILYLNNTSQVVDSFPSSATDPNAPLVTTNVSCNRVIEMSATNSEVLGNWPLIDMLDPRRII